MTASTTVDVEVTQGPTQTVIVTTSPPTSVTIGEPTTVNTVSTSTELVSVEELGIVGPRGPQGPPGGHPEVFELLAVSTWTYQHDFPYRPELRLVDVDNEAVEVGVEYPDAQTVSITFPVPFTGTVYLS